MNENTIGKRIQALRKERGMTQKQLADAVGVTPQAVSKWETDESCPDITALPLLAGTLGVSVDTLLSGTESASGPVLEGVVRDANETASSKKEKPYTWVWNAGKISGIIFGVFILLAGVLLILTKTKPEWFGEIGFWDIIWPSAIIFVGLAGCISRDISGFSLGIVAVGVLFLLKNLGVIEGSVWPIAIAIVLILVGVTTILHQFFKRKKKIKRNGNTVYVDGKDGKFRSDYSEDGGYIKYKASFGDDNVRFSSDKFYGGEVNVSFGDFDVDLTEVREIESGAELKANISFGDLTIHVPKSVRVELETAGSFSGKGVKGNPAPDAANVLRVKAAASFADFEIEYED
ncbi:MAG: helix-turn-helix domain-containing protein [Clostridia bacterium]|nr:helix-turn-helix domain-containing protein [Clostridia bacterium]